MRGFSRTYGFGSFLVATPVIACGSSVEQEAPACRAMWTRVFDGAIDERLDDVAISPADEVLVAGYARGLDFGGASLAPAEAAAFVAKLDAAGEHVWSRYLASTSGIARMLVGGDSAGSVVVTGNFEGTLDFGDGPLTSAAFDGYVVKLDATGGHRWSRHLARSDYQFACGIGTDAEDNVVVATSFEGAIELGSEELQSQGKDVLVVKLDPDGNFVWSKRFGDPMEQRCADLAVDPDGNVLVTGTFAGTIDFGGGALESSGGTSVLSDEDVFVAKLDPQGGHVWSHRIGTEGETQSHRVAAHASGAAVVAGSASEGIDIDDDHLAPAAGGAIFVANLNPAGAYEWVRLLEGAGDGPTGLAATPATVVVSGSSFGAFVAALNPNGEPSWSLSLLEPTGADSFGLIVGVDADSAGNAVAAGQFSPALDFGCGPVQSKRGADIFVAKLRAD